MTFSDKLSRVAHWPLRLALSSVFLYHGLTKFPNLEGLAEMMGMPVAAVAALACIEVAGAAFVLFGGVGKDWMTRLGGALIVPVMLGAIFLVHLQYGWNSVNMGSGNMGRGMEFQFTLLMMALYFVLKGNRTVIREARTTTARMHAQDRPAYQDDDQNPSRRQGERTRILS